MTKRRLINLAALALLACAAVGTAVAVLTYDLACNRNDGIDCYGRRSEFAVHRAMGLGGLVVAGAMAAATLRGHRRVAIAMLALALIVYAVAFLFADAGVHGWENLKVYPQL